MGEDLRNCDNIGPWEGIDLGKGVGYDDKISCWEANFGANRWVAKCNIRKKNFNVSLNNTNWFITADSCTHVTYIL